MDRIYPTNETNLVDGEGWNTRNPTAMTNGDRPQFMIPLGRRKSPNKATSISTLKNFMMKYKELN